jgi:hypothetical protein
MMSSGRWRDLGSAVLGVGALLAVGWLIYARQSHTSFWAWPGTAGVVIFGVGFVILIIGFVMPKDDERGQQIQLGGDRSTNLQAGRDIHIGNDKRED